MGEYDRKQQKQESRAVVYNDGGSRQLKGLPIHVRNNLPNIIQRVEYVNVQTEMSKNVTYGPNCITLDDGSYLEYDTADFALKHIEGSGGGAGTLLIYLFAKLAEKHGIKDIQVLTPAPTALGFYEKIGFRKGRSLGSYCPVSGLVRDIIKASNHLWVTKSCFVFTHRPRL